MEISNPPDTEFKTIVINMLNKLGRKTDGSVRTSTKRQVI